MSKPMLQFAQVAHVNDRSKVFIVHPDDDTPDTWVLVCPEIKGVSFVTTRDLKADYLPANNQACKLFKDFLGLGSKPKEKKPANPNPILPLGNTGLSYQKVSGGEPDQPPGDPLASAV